MGNAKARILISVHRHAMRLYLAILLNTMAGQEKALDELSLDMSKEL